MLAHRLDMWLCLSACVWASYRGGAANVWALIRGTQVKAGSTPASQRIFFRVLPVPEHQLATASGGGVTPATIDQPQRDIGAKRF